MKRYLFSLILIMFICYIRALQFDEVERFRIDDTRYENSTELKYHGDYVDGFISGTDKYAVRFNIVDSLFIIDSIDIYKTAHDAMDSGQIWVLDDLLNWETQKRDSINFSNLEPGWNSFEPIELANEELRGFYVVYADTLNHAPVPVSSGSGDNCFYYDENYNEAFVNFPTSTLNYELFIKVTGRYQNDENVVVELTNFDYQFVEGRFEPSFDIINKSNSNLNNLLVKITKIFPFENVSGSVATINDSTEIIQLELPEISANTEVNSSDLNIINIDDAKFEPEDKTQYHASAELVAPSSTPLSTNTDQSIYFDNFEIPNDNKLVINFIESYRNDILEIQGMYSESAIYLNSFPAVADSFYMDYASWLMTDLGIQDFPGSYLGDNSYVKYFEYPVMEDENILEGYSDRFVEYLNEDNVNKFFLVVEDSLKCIDNVDYEVNLEIRNVESTVLNSYLGNLEIRTFVVANIRQIAGDNAEVWDFYHGLFLLDEVENVISTENTSDIAFQKDVITKVDVDFFWDGSNIPDYEMLYDFHLLYFLKDGNNILHVDTIAFEDFTVGTEEEINTQPNIVNYPNPFSKTQKINIETSRGENVTSLKTSIYNLKGQKIKSISTSGRSQIEWDGTDNSNKKVSSGIYFMKISGSTTKGKFSTTKRCVMIK